ncbi:MAG: Phosphate transport system permease protein PstC [Pelotomaculum sp. PtaU1.Bin035]|nr:MAG: Phosphate transport system permease protein PstC [Pelotomaculum sp. PtaU1.Bin035]
MDLAMRIKKKKSKATMTSISMSLQLRYDRFFKFVFFGSAAAVSLVIFTIILFVAFQGLQTFKEASALDFFINTTWSPPAHYGIFSFIFSSFATTLLALLIGAPLGLAGAIFMAKIAPQWVRDVLRPATDLFVGIPSVVYGWIGMTIFVGIIRDNIGGSGFGVLAAGTVLSVMILPTVISISEDSLRALPQSLEEASYALGANRWQTIRRVLLPAASPGLLAAVILAMARAIGETMAVQMVIGNSPQFPASLVLPTATLTSWIVVEMGNTPFGSTINNALFLMAFTLLGLSMATILLVRVVVRRRMV